MSREKTDFRISSRQWRSGTLLPMQFACIGRDLTELYPGQLEIHVRIKDVGFLGIGLVKLKLNLAKNPAVSIAREDSG